MKASNPAPDVRDIRAAVLVLGSHLGRAAVDQLLDSYDKSVASDRAKKDWLRAFLNWASQTRDLVVVKPLSKRELKEIGDAMRRLAEVMAEDDTRNAFVERR